MKWEEERKDRALAVQSLRQKAKDVAEKKNALTMKVIVDTAESLSTLTAFKIIQEVSPGLPNAEHREAAIVRAKAIIAEEITSFREAVQRDSAFQPEKPEW
jgi:hypothetical protein